MYAFQASKSEETEILAACFPRYFQITFFSKSCELRNLFLEVFLYDVKWAVVPAKQKKYFQVQV